jgi:hypothetical protein
MANRSKSGPKTPKDQSEKAHVKRPPREIEPHIEERPEGRHAGQYTGQGNPGIQKK